MKKDGDYSVLYRGAAHIVFIFLIVYVISIFFIHPEFFGNASLTGYAVYEGDVAKQKLETALSGASFVNMISNANICVLIRDLDREHVLKVRKTPMGVTVVDSNDYYCDGKAVEDLIIKFVSYDAFIELMDSFTVENVVAGRAGNSYYILDSKLVKPGGDVVCDQSFKDNFCNAVMQLGTPEQLIAGDMYCCLDSLTRDQQRLLSDHLAESGFENEMATVEEPAEIPNLSYLFVIILGVFILLGVGVFLFRRKPKVPVKPVEVTKPVVPMQAPPEDPRMRQLKDYIVNTLKVGYPREQVYQYLQQQGWRPELLNKAFSEIEQRRQQ
jgi:hypothetical protein